MELERKWKAMAVEKWRRRRSLRADLPLWPAERFPANGTNHDGSKIQRLHNLGRLIFTARMQPFGRAEPSHQARADEHCHVPQLGPHSYFGSPALPSTACEPGPRGLLLVY